MQKGYVYRNGILSGIIHKDDSGTIPLYTFTYTEEYLHMKGSRPISVNFPMQSEPFESHILFAFFSNMLAEGNTKTLQCQQLHIDEEDLFTRLLKTTSVNTIGAVTVTDEIPKHTSSDLERGDIL